MVYSGSMLLRCVTVRFQVLNNQNTLIVQSILQNTVKKIRGYTFINIFKHT